MWRLVSLLARDTGISADAGSNTNLNNALENVISFVETYVLGVLYVVLGLFLVVKGAMLGVQIVKAADEPQVRQEKIGSLKWLIIGVAIAFAVVIAADIVMDVFSSNFTSTGTAK